MTYNDQLLAALKLAETAIDSQMSLMPAKPPRPLWAVLEELREAIALAERGPSLKDIDEELALFP